MIYVLFTGVAGQWVAAFPGLTNDQISSMLAPQGLVFSVIDQPTYNSFIQNI